MVRPTLALCWPRAMELQRRLWAFNEAFAKHGLAACIKGGLQLQGFEDGAPLPPQDPMSQAGAKKIRQALAAVGAQVDLMTGFASG